MRTDFMNAVRYIENYITNIGLDAANFEYDVAACELQDIAQMTGVDNYAEIGVGALTQILIDAAD